MMDPRYTLWFLTFALVLGGCTTSGPGRMLEAEDASLAPAAWLTGAWVSRDVRAGGPRTEEHWTAPSAGTMIGVNRTVAGGKTVFFEYLRIERAEDGGLVYLASPNGRSPATPFRLADQSPGRLVFENMGHEYPQRIIYSRTSNGALLQRIEGEENGVFKEGEWSLVRARTRTQR